MRAGRTICISNAGIGTLQFDLSEAEKQQLIDIGRSAVYEAYGLKDSDYSSNSSQAKLLTVSSPVLASDTAMECNYTSSSSPRP